MVCVLFMVCSVRSIDCSSGLSLCLTTVVSSQASVPLPVRCSGQSQCSTPDKASTVDTLVQYITKATVSSWNTYPAYHLLSPGVYMHDLMDVSVSGWFQKVGTNEPIL